MNTSCFSFPICLMVSVLLVVATRDSALAADTPQEGDKVERLIQQLGSDSFQERVQAAEELVSVGAPALEPLRRLMKGANPDLRRWAEKCVPQIERNVKIAICVKDLSEAKDPKVRVDATGYLAELGPAAVAAVPALIKALDDENPLVRERAVITLGCIGPGAKPAVSKLVQILRDTKEDEGLRWCMIGALEQIGPSAEEAIPTLLWVLETESPTLMKRAAGALGSVDRSNPKVVSALVRALKHPDAFVQATAAVALGKLAREPKTCVPAIMDVVKSHKGATGVNDPRPLLLDALQFFGVHARPAVPFIIELATDERENRTMRIGALRTLQELGPVAKEAAPFLKEMQNDPVFGEAASRVLRAILGFPK